MSEPFGADSVEETVGRLGAIIINGWDRNANAVSNQFRAIPRPPASGPARPAEITVSDLAAQMRVR